MFRTFGAVIGTEGFFILSTLKLLKRLTNKAAYKFGDLFRLSITEEDFQLSEKKRKAGTSSTWAAGVLIPSELLLKALRAPDKNFLSTMLCDSV